MLELKGARRKLTQSNTRKPIIHNPTTLHQSDKKRTYKMKWIYLYHSQLNEIKTDMKNKLTVYYLVLCLYLQLFRRKKNYFASVSTSIASCCTTISNWHRKYFQLESNHVTCQSQSLFIKYASRTRTIREPTSNLALTWENLSSNWCV